MASKRNVTGGAVDSITVDGKGRPVEVGKARVTKTGAKRMRGPVGQDKKEAKATGRSEPASKSARSTNTKADLIIKKLRTAKGASMEMLIAETGWQAHSVRGFLSAVVKKKLALSLVSESGKDGGRRYRIDGDAKSE